jgi:probable HAF family extracellular repeat protein
MSPTRRLNGSRIIVLLILDIDPTNILKAFPTQVTIHNPQSMLQHSLTRGLARITTVALAMACLSGTAQAAGYTLTLLGDLPGGPNLSRAYGLNDAGQVVGYSDDATGRQAFLWDAVGGMQGLGDLPGGNLLTIEDIR